MPELIANTADNALAQSMPITKAVPIGAHMSVPVRLADGQAYGIFCCLSPHANKSLNERDLQIMRAFAEMARGQISKDTEEKRKVDETRMRVERVIEDAAFNMVFQPVWDFRSGHPTDSKPYAGSLLNPIDRQK